MRKRVGISGEATLCRASLAPINSRWVEHEFLNRVQLPIKNMGMQVREKMKMSSNKYHYYETSENSLINKL